MPPAVELSHRAGFSYDAGMAHDPNAKNAEGPTPTPEEEGASLERLREEDAQRYPAWDDPEQVVDRNRGED